MIGALEERLFELRNQLQDMHADELFKLQLQTYILGFQEAAQISAKWLNKEQNEPTR